MDFLLTNNNLYILVIALISGGMLLWPSFAKKRGGAAVEVQEAIQLANQKQAVFIDIRPHDQFKLGSIPQSRNIPHADLESKISTLSKDKPIIVVCAKGQESIKAAAELRKHGFTEVVNLAGGLNNWVQAGLPLKKH